MAEKCEYCGSTNIRYNEQWAEMICDDCGIVQESLQIVAHDRSLKKTQLNAPLHPFTPLSRMKKK